MKLEFESINLPGTKGRNDDYVFGKILKEGALFVVADGCGGHEGANFASRYLCEALNEHIETEAKNINLHPEKGMKKFFQLAKKDQANKLRSEGLTDACTTCGIAWITSKQMIFAHVGDTRIYHINKNEVLYRTKDHSFVQQLVESGMVSDEAMARHPMGNILSNSVGPSTIGNPTISIQSPLQSGEGIILCTDGFWRLIENSLLFKLLKEKDLKKGLLTEAQKLLKREENYDDMTVMFVRR